MPSKAELLQYLQTKYEEQQRKNKPLGWGDRLLSPEVRGRQNSISQPGPGVEDPGLGEKLLTGGMALSNLPATGASILLQKLQDHLFPSEPSITDSLIPDPLTGELKPAQKLESVVPRWTKTQRKALQTLQKFPTREDYTNPAKNPGLYTGPWRKSWGQDMDVMNPALKPEVVDRGKIQFTTTPTRDFVRTYLDGKPAASISVNSNTGEIGVTESALSARGKGVGKELYKFLGQQGKDIYKLHDTSTDAAHARYAAIEDLAKGKFSPAKPLPMSRDITSRPDPKGIDLELGGKPEVSGQNLAPIDLKPFLSTKTARDPNKPTTAKVFDTLKDGSPKIQALKRGIKSESSANSQELGENNLDYSPALSLIDAKEEWLRRLLRLMPARMELPDKLAPERSDLRTVLLNLLDDNQNQAGVVGAMRTPGRVPNTVQDYINRLPEFRRPQYSGFGFDTQLSRHTPKTQALVERLQQLLRQSSEHRGENYNAYYGPRDFK